MTISADHLPPGTLGHLPPLSLLDIDPGRGDLAAARRFVAVFDDRLLWAPTFGWLFWTGRYWAPVTLERVKLWALLVAEAFAAEVADHPAPPAESKGAAAWGLDIRAASRTVETAASLVEADPAQFNARPDLLAFRNGTVNLREGNLYAPRSDYFLTRCLPFDYDPDAAPEAFLAFLESVQPDPEVRAYLGRLLGYGITGETSEQVLSVWIGGGANGKSVLQEVLTRLLGSYVETPAFSAFTTAGEGKRFALAGLRDARLAFAPEGNAGAVLDEALLKRATGQDSITAERKYQDAFTFRPQFLVVLVSNAFPRIVTDDEGTWRRFHVLPWTQTFAPEDRIPDLAARLVAAEGPAILSWLVARAAEWYASGLQPPAAVTAETDRRRDLSDSLAGFYGVVLTPDPGSYVRIADVHDAFSSWADAAGLGEDARFHTSAAFRSALEERGAYVYKRNGVMTVKDHRLDHEAAVERPDSILDPSRVPAGPHEGALPVSSAEGAERLRALLAAIEDPIVLSLGEVS